MYQLEAPTYFYLLLVIPLLLLLFLQLLLWRHRTRKKFADSALLRKLSPDTSTFKSIIKTGVLLLAFACLVIALVNPKIGTKLETVKREGVAIVFAIDVSKSMLAEDIAPNRLEKAKRIVSEIINNLAGDKTGIVVYAGQAFPQLPITTDYAAAKMFLQNINTDMVSSQGTAIDEAITLAQKYYDPEDPTNKVLFIISDGEDHSDNALSAVEEAAEQGIRVFTIGVGTAKGSPIPEKLNGIVESYKKDQNGEVVITKRNDLILTEIAQRGKGAYIDGTSTEDAIAFVKETLEKMDKTEFEAKQFADFKGQFQWFLGAAIALLLLDIFLLERKTAWLKRLNLFNEEKY